MFAACDAAITQLASKTGFGGPRPARTTGSLTSRHGENSVLGLRTEADPGYSISFRSTSTAGLDLGAQRCPERWIILDLLFKRSLFQR